jgi:hypothetical protein
MNKSLGSLALVCVGAAAFAQSAPFTIIYPPDGTKVKEKINIRFPNNSIPSNSYVGIFLDGKLMEATRPTLVTPKDANGRSVGRPYFQYTLDVKGRGLANDTAKSMELKAVLFTEVNDTPRTTGDSSVKITVDKTAGIMIPEGGLKLRYNFKPGTELSYRMDERSSITTILERESNLGGRAAEYPLESESLRLLYAFDNSVKSGQSTDYIVRMQALPDKGKTYADLTTVGSTAPKRYQDYEMAPVYMQMSPTGLQRWGAIPPYVQFEGTGGEGARLDLYAVFPLPTLPEKSIKPGDSWQSRFQNGSLNLDKLYEVTSVVRTIPARGEFIGVEWERGRRCAVLKNSIEAGTRSLESRYFERAGTPEDTKFSLTETIWFDLDRKVIVKIFREQTIDTTQDASQFLGVSGAAAAGGGVPGGAPGGFPAGGPAGAPGGQRGGLPSLSGAGGAAGGGAGGKMISGGSPLGDFLRQLAPRGQRGGGQRGAPGFGAPGGVPGLGGPGGAPFGGPGFGGQGRIGQLNANDKILTRIRIQRTFILE